MSIYPDDSQIAANTISFDVNKPHPVEKSRFHHYLSTHNNNLKIVLDLIEEMKENNGNTL